MNVALARTLPIWPLFLFSPSSYNISTHALVLPVSFQHGEMWTGCNELITALSWTSRI